MLRRVAIPAHWRTLTPREQVIKLHGMYVMWSSIHDNTGSEDSRQKSELLVRALRDRGYDPRSSK